MIRVLVVEDSAVVREFLVHILNSEPGIRVIGTASDGEGALEFLERERPDVIAMDINMPGMNGIEATRRIMETRPVPIVIVSGVWNPREVETTFRAMEAGALAVVQKPRGIGHSDHEATVREMLRKIKLMSEVKLVRRWPRAAGITKDEGRFPPAPLVSRLPSPSPRIKAVAVGASTGGPPVLNEILGSLPGDFPAPLLIVQHIAAGFLKGMVEWIAGGSRLKVTIAADRETPLPGHAYFAPDGLNMGVGTDGRIALSGCDSGNGPCPSVSHLFGSVARAYGREAIGVLLSGMGSDGAQELKLMKDLGAVTIIQDRESAAVYGMPGVAEEMGAALYALAPGKIVAALTAMAAGAGKTKGEA